MAQEKSESAKEEHKRADVADIVDSQNEQHSQTQQNEDQISLFDGKSLEGWVETDFGGEEMVEVINGELIMKPGYPLTGVNRDREEELPTSNYEISLEAKRIEGTDFFCGLTFPVKDSHCSLIVAGWAGATVGLSCVDNLDASSNDTTCFMNFENDRWYKIRLLVTDAKIVCWIDDEEVIFQELEGHTVQVRGDVVATRPLGLCAFECKVAYKNILMTKIDPNEEAAKAKQSEDGSGK